MFTDLVCSVAGSAGDALGDDSVAYGIEQFTISASYDEDFFMVVFVIFHFVLLLIGFDISMILSCKGNNNIRKYQNFSPKIHMK